MFKGWLVKVFKSPVPRFLRIASRYNFLQSKLLPKNFDFATELILLLTDSRDSRQVIRHESQYVIGYWGSGYLSRAHVTRVWLRHVAISFLLVEPSRPFWSHYKGNRYPKAAEEDLDRKVVRLRRNHNVHSIPKNEFWDRPMKLWHKVIFTKSSIPTNL